MCLWGAPLPRIQRSGGGAGRPHGVRPKGGNPTPTRSRFPLFLVQLGGEGKEREREGKGAGPPPQFGLGLGERAPPLGRLLLSSTMAHEGPLTPRGVPVTPPPPGTPENARTYPKPFWCPNIAFQYINLHVSAI